jgi:hypothetical protein
MKRTYLAILILSLFLVSFSLLLSFPSKANILPSFIINTARPSMEEFRFFNQAIYAVEDDGHTITAFSYDSSEILTYTFENILTDLPASEDKIYAITCWETYDGISHNGQFELWELQVPGPAILIGPGQQWARNATIIADEVYISTPDDDPIRDVGKVTKWDISPWSEAYSVDIKWPADILVGSQYIYVLDNAPRGDVLDLGHSRVDGPCLLQHIKATRRSSGTVIGTIEVKGGVSGMYLYGNNLVCTHSMYLDQGYYSTITFVDSSTFQIDEEIKYENYLIHDSIKTGNLLVATILEWIDELNYDYTNKILLFDLDSRAGSFKELNHLVNTIEYDPINEYVFIHPPDDGDIYVYTLDSVING